MTYTKAPTRFHFECRFSTRPLPQILWWNFIIAGRLPLPAIPPYEFRKLHFVERRRRSHYRASARVFHRLVRERAVEHLRGVPFHSYKSRPWRPQVGEAPT